VLVTCEHGGNRVPPGYRELFRGYEAVLDSHRGHDAGSLALARTLARRLRAPLHSATVTRLLVDLNRSLHHRNVFSELTRALPDTERQRIVQRFYLPYRHGVEHAIAAAVRDGFRVLHLSAHSFTPELDGYRRDADIGLLYDPRRQWERRLAAGIKTALRRHCPTLAVRRNYPYRGCADGFTTALRRDFADPRYAGIEIEINQRVVAGDAAAWRALRNCCAEAVRSLACD
jgi:predicted N-formylglutamate amidohydrolase